MPITKDLGDILAQLRLLVVDDDAHGRDVWGLSLRKAGYDVVTTRDAEAALDTLQTGRIDVVVSETYLPGMGGFALCEHIRKNPDLGHVAFAFVTYSDAIEDRVRGFEVGCDEYLVKPLFFRELVDRIETLARRRQLAAQNDRQALVGKLSELGVVDLVQLMEMQHKHGLIQLTGPRQQRGELHFVDGELVNAQTATRSGEAAAMRVFGWDQGSFKVTFTKPEGERQISRPINALIMDGLQHAHSCDELTKLLPSRDASCALDHHRLDALGDELSTDECTVARLFDGDRSIDEVIDAAAMDDLSALAILKTLIDKCLLLQTTNGMPVLPRSRAETTIPQGDDPSAQALEHLTEEVRGALADLDDRPQEPGTERSGQSRTAEAGDSPVASGVTYVAVTTSTRKNRGCHAPSVETELSSSTIDESPPIEPADHPPTQNMLARHTRRPARGRHRQLFWATLFTSGWLVAAWVGFSAAPSRVANPSPGTQATAQHPASQPTQAGPATPATHAPDPTSQPRANERSLILRSRVLAAAGQREPAHELLAQAAQQPNAWMATEQLALDVLARGRDAEAARIATRAAKLNPRAPYAQFVLGCVAQQAGRRRAAKAAYQRFVALCPECRFAAEVRSVLRYL